MKIEQIDHDSANIVGDSSVQSYVEPETGRFRMMLPQIIACSVKNLLLINLGLTVGFSTIVIPALSGVQNHRNPHEYLRFTAVQASWFGSLVYLTQPIGAIASGWITESIGRKKAMLLVNVPHITAWTMFYFAGSVTELFVAGVLLGLGIGLMESPILTYVGEISHPSIRGILLAYSHVTVIIGSCIMYVIGSLTTWRNAAALCLMCPCVSVVALLFIPETPHWLLTHHRPDDALVSLQWLRGWVQPAAVQQEYAELVNYIQKLNACIPCQQRGNRCTHRTGCLSKATELLRANVLRPFGLVVICFIIVQANGIAAIKPFLVQIFEAFGVPMDPNWASVILGTMDALANITCMLAIRSLGKRIMCLTAVFGSAVCCFVLSINAFLTIPSGVSSFQTEDLKLIEHNNYTALLVFVVLAYLAGITHSVAWMFVSEVFPIRVRGLASGFSAATGYFVVFVFTKTYYSLESTCSIWGAFMLYGCASAAGFVLQMFILPDTEGHTLEEIEEYFSDNSRAFNDTRISRVPRGTDEGSDAVRRRAHRGVSLEDGSFSEEMSTVESPSGRPTMRFDNKAFV